MNIVLNEYEWAEKMLNSHQLGDKPSETLNRISRYYLVNQYSKQEIRQLLDIFVLQCDPNASLTGWSNLLDSAAKNADRYPIVQLDGIDITEPELKRIEALKGKQLRRLAFTLLCVSKYWDAVSPQNDHWANTENRELFQMANISTSTKRQSLMFSDLRDAGYIKYAKKIDNLNVQVLFSEPGPVAMHIHDFRNLGYQYLKYYGEAFYECQNCGLTVKLPNNERGRKPKYCTDCAAEIKTQQSVNAVMRRRMMLSQ